MKDTYISCIIISEVEGTARRTKYREGTKNARQEPERIREIEIAESIDV